MTTQRRKPAPFNYVRHFFGVLLILMTPFVVVIWSGAFQ
jgi:hypothetical protein